jgi:hypothetical protein
MKRFINMGLIATTLLVGCPDEGESKPAPSQDGATSPDAATAVAEAGADASVSLDASTTDGSIDLFGLVPLGDAGCPACIRDRCGANINKCANNPACALGLLCTLQTCATGLLGGDGGVDATSLACALGCFNGDQATGLTAIGSLTCLTMTCGATCGLGGTGDAGTQPDASTDAMPPDVGQDSDGGEQTDGD